jgi:hypothetical protein
MTTTEINHITAPKYVTMTLSNFGHDINGNAIAKHVLAHHDGFLSTDSEILYETKKRLQVGCDGSYLGAVREVFAKANLDSMGYLLVLTEGHRSINKIVFHFELI